MVWGGIGASVADGVGPTGLGLSVGIGFGLGVGLGSRDPAKGAGRRSMIEGRGAGCLCRWGG